MPDGSSGSQSPVDAGVRDARSADASAGAAGSTGAGGPGDGGGTPPPPPTTQHLAIGVHDPSMIHAGSQWYLFATGGSLGIRSSANMTQYANAGSIFPNVPAWVSTALGQNITALWAPDVSFFAGKYHVYFAGSTFGSNHSVIGLATNTTLDRNAAGYAWVDEGLVIESNPPGRTDNWNAIDPNVAFDTEGNVWLTWGSFWSGIKLRQLDPVTGKLSTTNTMLYSLNTRPGNGAVEAPSIVYHNGFYYLFVSYDICCRGVTSTYRTMVGRSQSITGPYTDRAGASMLQGNAEELLATNGRYIGPGGGTAFHDGDYFYYAHHYYDGMANGNSFLSVRPITWTADDWPALGEQLWQ
jgi:arabinan endo-1,5-alpha-L-arabinosidase